MHAKLQNGLPPFITFLTRVAGPLESFPTQPRLEYKSAEDH